MQSIATDDLAQLALCFRTNMVTISSSIKVHFHLQHFSSRCCMNSGLTASQCEIILQRLNCVTQRAALDH